MFGALLWRGTHLTAAWVCLVLGSALVTAGLVAATRLGPIYRGWMALAAAISKVTTPVFMVAVFFLVLTPAGLLARLFGHRPLSRRRGATTYWQTRSAESRRGQMDHQF